MLVWLSVSCELQTCICPIWCHCHSPVSCFSKIQIGCTFLLLDHQGSLGQRSIKQASVCVISVCCCPCCCRRFTDNTVAQLWYFTKCVYFALSAYQIRCGYPTRILGNFLTKKYNYLNLICFKGYIYIFVFFINKLFNVGLKFVLALHIQNSCLHITAPSALYVIIFIN